MQEQIRPALAYYSAPLGARHVIEHCNAHGAPDGAQVL
jgi:hypothetical protein